MVHQEFLEQPLEEVLELIWRQKETGDTSLAGLLEKSQEPDTKDILDQLATQKLVALENGRIRLLDAGEARAQTVVRRMRLTERLLSDVLDVPLDESEQQACLMEHVLSPAVTSAVCSFLGHPPTCPHGLSIPAGPCCEKREAMEPLVVPLEDLAPGDEARIVFIAPGVVKRLDRLGSFGVVPGTILNLRQKQPSMVLEIGGTTLALEAEIAGEIYVRRES